MLQVVFRFTCKFPTLLTPGLYIKNVFKKYSEMETSTLCFRWNNYSCTGTHLRATLKLVCSKSQACTTSHWLGWPKDHLGSE